MNERKLAWGTLPHWVQPKPDQFAATVKPGDACRHRGTRDWAIVTAVEPRGRDSAELVLTNVEDGRAQYWATYHVDYWAPAADIPEELGAAA